MLVTITLNAGSDHRDTVTSEDVKRNIEALERAKPATFADHVLLRDTISILRAIKTAITRPKLTPQEVAYLRDIAVFHGHEPKWAGAIKAALAALGEGER